MAKNFYFPGHGCLQSCLPQQRKTARAVLGAAFFSTFGVGAFTFALSLTALSAGISASWLGLAFSGYFLARLVLAPLAGYGADYIGPMPLLLAASTAGTAIPFLYLLFPHPEILGLIQVGLGFCAGIIKPISMSLLGSCAPPEKRGSLFGPYNTCLYAAFILAPLAGGAAVKLQGGIGSITLVCAAAGMGSGLILFLGSGPTPQQAPPGSKESAQNNADTRSPWKNPAFLALLLAVLGRTTGASVIITFLPRLLDQNFGLNGMQAGLIFALPNIAIILGMPTTSRWADSFDRSGLTFLGMGICAAGIFSFGQQLPLWGLVSMVALLGCGSAISLPASMSLAADMGSARGSVMGVFLAVSNLGFVLGPGLAGFAASKGAVSDAFELTALFGGLCLLPVFLIMSRKKQNKKNTGI